MTLEQLRIFVGVAECEHVTRAAGLSAGHDALHDDVAATVPLAVLALIFATKCLASIVSLGFGYRGGLFFASLCFGTFVGHPFAGVLALAQFAWLRPTYGMIAMIAGLVTAYPVNW